MIKAIGLRKVDITEEELNYYKELVSKYTDNNKGSSYFENLFETDKNGIITIIKPSNNLPWEILFFVQNLMISQHLRAYDSRISDIELKLKQGVKNGED
jgi:hypothetical protein